jgi:crotonobetainyl-CoA:carnitine CoA-transferase CaiB-like acyl-CoA transferase
VTSSLLDAVVSMMPMRETEFQFSGQLPELLGTAHGQAVPGQAFKTKDDHIVMLALYTNDHFQKWCKIMGREDLGADERFQTNRSRKQHMAATVAAVQEVIGEYTIAELDKKIAGQLPYGPMLGFDELWENPQLLENDMILEFQDAALGTVRNVSSPVHFSHGKISVRQTPPHLGEHSEQILRDFGVPPEEIAELLRSGVVQSYDGTADNPATD